MSKPIARVVFITLISLALIAATYVTVQGAVPKVGASAQAHIVSGLQTNLNHYRASVADQTNYANPVDDTHKNGGCHSDSQNSPED